VSRRHGLDDWIAGKHLKLKEVLASPLVILQELPVNNARAGALRIPQWVEVTDLRDEVEVED
jgi:hypothetical protein